MAGWFWLITWGLWWLIIVMGAQGTSPVLGLIGLLALPILIKKRPTFSLDAIVFFSFLIWCILTGLWSDLGDKKILIWDPANENFAIESPGARLAFVGALGSFAYWAMHQFPDKIYRYTRWAAIFGLGIVTCLMLAGTVYLNVFRDIAFQRSGDADAVQNLIRSLNISLLAIPLFIGLLPVKKLIYRIGLLIVILAIAVFLANQLEVFASILVIIGIMCTLGLVLLLGRRIHLIFGVLTAFLIVVSPAIYTEINTQINTISSEKIPASVELRLNSNEFILQKIQERWLIGWGVDAVKSWDQTTTTKLDGQDIEVRVVHGHPHNMPLHIWVETGAVGAVLLSIFAFLFGRRLYNSESTDIWVIFTEATLWIGVIIFGSYSYSVWNDGFWTGLALIGAGMLLLPPNRRTTGESV